MTATTLTVGDLAIIGVNTQDTVPGGTTANDLISFILTAPIGSGTTIYFTDRGWNGSSFTNAAGDGTFTYTAGSDLAAGSIITISAAQLAGAGMALSESGEAIYAYQGTSADAPTRFLHAIDIGDGNSTFNGNLTNTGLVNGVSALAIADNNAEFGTRTDDINRVDLFANINTASHWVHNDNSMQDGTATGTPAYTAPDAQIWVAGSGAGEAIVTINLDSTYGSGTLGYQIVQAFQNDANLFHPSDITLDTVHGKFFFVDSDISGGHNRIVEGSISQLLANPGAAGTFNVLYSDSGTTSASSMRTLSVDTANGIIYFDHGTTFDKITYSLTGTSTSNQTPTVLANLGSGNFITQVAIDYAHGEVYLGSSRITSFFGSDAITKNYIYKATGLTAGSSTLTFGQLPFNPDDAGFGSEGSPLSGEGWPVELGNIRGIDVDPINHDLYIVTGSVILDNDGDGSTSYPGGIYRYDLDSNPTGTYTNLFTQNGSTGPLGLLYYIEVDPTTGRYYVVDETGTNANPGDGGIWTGSLSGAGTPTLVGTVGNVNGLGPQGLEIQHAPTLSSSFVASPTYTETAGNPSPNGTPIALANSFNSTDADSGTATVDQLAGAQVRISSGFQSGSGHQDVLTINGNTSGTIELGAQDISYSYNSATGVMTLSGAQTLDNYEAALALVRIRIDGDNPTNYGNNSSRVVSFSTFDGLLYSDEQNVTVTITGVNDAPINTVPGVQTINEDNTRVFSAFNGNALSVSDVDADPASQSLQVTLSVTQGTLTLGSTTGLSFSDGDGTSDTTMTFTGTANSINQILAIAGLTYTPTGDYNGSDTLTFTVNDLGLNGNDAGLTGSGTSEQDSDTVTITINPVADIANDSPTTNEDSAVNVLVQGNDTFENPVHSITAFDQGSHGSVALNDNGTAGNTADDYLVYTPDADYNGSDSFTYTVTSGGVTETATVNVTVNAVADIVDDSPTTDEDTAVYVLVQGNDTFENPAHSITGFTQGSHGAVSIDDNGTAGDTTDDFLVYTPDADYNGSDSFTYTVTSAGIAETATVNVTINAVDDPAIVQNDTFTTDEATAIVGGDLFADNGSGADSDFDGPALSIAAVNGSAASVGSQITLGSGALLTVNADGTFDYDPNHAFDGVPAAASGASNTPGTDSFTYAVADGSTATVTITIGGLDNDDDLIGTPANDTLDGGAGDDSVQGLAGDDVLVGGAGDDIIDGSSGIDRASYAGATAGVRVGLTLGMQDTLGAGIDTISGIENLTGSGFDDILGGTSGANSIDGGDGRDLIFAYSGNDSLYGGDADDRLDGGAGNDLLDGGAGLDNAYYGNATAGVTVSLAIGTAQDTLGAGIDTLVSIERLNGSRFDDTLSGDGQANAIYGAAGNDSIAGVGGNDRLWGAEGNDLLNGGDDDDILDGGAGDDAIDGGNGVDIAAYDSAGSAVTVSLAVAGAQDTLGAGIDTLANIEGLAGSDFNDTLSGNGGANSLDGGDGNDVLEGGPGDDFINGGSGTDSASFAGATAGVYVGLLLGTQDTLGAGIDTILRVENLTGSGFADTLAGTLGANSINGGAGNDLIFGYSGNDSLFGGDGSDRLDGGAGNDLLDGGDSLDDAYYGNSTAAVTVSLAIGTAQNTIGAGIDTLVSIERLVGSRFDDTLTGDGQANTINGIGGNDLIDGGDGNDILYGGNGADTFRFSTILNPTTNVDQLRDFAVADDTIELSQSIFGGPLGTLSASAFQTGASASDADDRIIYDSTTGNIYYDSDGNGGAAQVLFAHVTAGLALTSADFLIGA